MSETQHHFIHQRIEHDLASGKHQQICTRFPPEPNGYLHLGHAKSIVLNFGIGQDYAGWTNLRFDDTNPAKEDAAYVAAIQQDVRWLGYTWHAQHFASDYFEALYDYAVQLIRRGQAYVCDLNAEQVRAHRGSLTEPGTDSPYRNRSIAENLDLFARMRAGEYPDGSRTLRARIDMAAPNINLRDPTLYRIRHGLVHHQTGEAWCIYPLYDYTHPISDALEGITHSLCTLEFADHRPLYDWILDNLDFDPRPQQIEFARLNLSYTVLSKRKLTRLVAEGHVSGWDDPRLPTLAGLRRRGYPASAIREFCHRIGVTRADSLVEMAMLESAARDELDQTAPRRMAVLNPLKVVITNYPADQTEALTAPNHPKRDDLGARTLTFSRELYIDQADFRATANKKYKRLVLGGEVRLRHAYVIRAEKIIRDETDQIVALHATYDPDTLGKNPEGRKVRGVIQWVAAATAVPAEVRLYDRLFQVAEPGKTADLINDLNPGSLQIRPDAMLEASLAQADTATPCQFEREGYFCRDITDTADGRPIYNRTVSLRDTWQNI